VTTDFYYQYLPKSQRSHYCQTYYQLLLHSTATANYLSLESTTPRVSVVVNVTFQGLAVAMAIN